MSLTFSDVLDVGHWTIGDVEAVRVEEKIDDAVNQINRRTSLSIAHMTGAAGSKTLTCTDGQEPIIKFLAALYCVAYITAGSTVGLNIRIGELNSEKIDDFAIRRWAEEVAEGVRSLRMPAIRAFNEPFV